MHAKRVFTKSKRYHKQPINTFHEDPADVGRQLIQCHVVVYPDLDHSKYLQPMARILQLVSCSVELKSDDKMKTQTALTLFPCDSPWSLGRGFS